MTYYILTHMKGVNIYPNIKFLPLEDREGYFGLLIMHDNENNIVMTETVEDRDQFNDVYSRWICQVQAFIHPYAARV